MHAKSCQTNRIRNNVLKNRAIARRRVGLAVKSLAELHKSELHVQTVIVIPFSDSESHRSLAEPVPTQFLP